MRRMRAGHASARSPALNALRGMAPERRARASSGFAIFRGFTGSFHWIPSYFS